MPDQSKPQPQANFQDNQTFEIDIIDMFRDFINGSTIHDSGPQNVAIDDLRSQINIDQTFQSGKKLIDSLHIGSLTSAATTNNTTSPGQLEQESRCHTFFRIIGFPVVSSNKQDFYNPGLDIIKDGIPRNMPLDKKITIAKNPIDGFETLSKNREIYQNNTTKIFSNPESLEAGILSLMSGTYASKGNVNIRKFSSPFESSNDNDPFEISTDKQSYVIGDYSLVGNKETLFQDYKLGDGIDPNFTTTNPSVFLLHSHIIKPFIVDPRIDFSVFPIDSSSSRKTSKRIAVPFVPDQSYLKASANSYAERPLLEKIIRERFSQTDQISDSGKASQDLINYVKNFQAIQDVSLVTQVFSGNIYKLSEQTSFVQYLSIIQSMIFKLVDSMRIIHHAQGLYYWLPQPTNKSGPEIGAVVRNIIINQNFPAELITPADLNIIFKSTSATIADLNATITQSNAIPDIGGYAFSAFKLTFSPDGTDSLTSIDNGSLDIIVKKRESELNKANQALQIVEMIMGEFSGFGLCDIIAIMGALYVMPKENLLGFLDSDSIIRAQKALGNSIIPNSKPGLTESMTILSNTVKSFYTIMDKIFDDYRNNGALNA